MVKKTLGDRIRLVRERASLSQEGFAVALAVTPATINRYEKGHRVPDADFLNQLVIEFECDPGWLLTGIEHKREVPSGVAEVAAAYNVRDIEIQEIVGFLKENPVDKKVILKLIKSKKMAKEALEEFAGVKGLVKES